MTRASATGPILIGALALVWGSNFLWIKVALGVFSPVQVTAARILLGAVVLVGVVLGRRDALPKEPRTWGHLFVAALVGNSVPYMSFALGETRVESGIAGALNATTPLWTLVLSVVVRHAGRLSALQVGGLVLGFGGSLLIFTPWDARGVDVLGAGFCFLAALSYGVSYLYMSRFLAPRNMSPTVLSASQLLAASVFMAICLPFDSAGAPAWALGPWLALAVLGVAGSGLAYVINYALIRAEGPVGASVVTYLIPVTSLGLGFLVLGEAVSMLSLLGVAVILVGIWASRRPAALT